MDLLATDPAERPLFVQIFGAQAPTRWPGPPSGSSNATSPTASTSTWAARFARSSRPAAGRRMMCDTTGATVELVRQGGRGGAGAGDA